MKVLVVGASGHVGSYLVKELVLEGYSVTAVMRGSKEAYGYDESVWSQVEVVKMSRDELIDSSLLDNNYDVICDLIAFDLEGVKRFVSKIKNDAFYIQIGSIWTYGNKEYLPVDENHPKNATDTYGSQKGLIEDYLLDLSLSKKLRTTVIHPGHVSGKYWDPINPQGNLDFSFYEKIKNGEEVVLPFLGLTTLHHIHAFDLARIIVACIKNQDKANGEAFIAVTEKCMTMRAMTEKLFKFFNQDVNITYLDWPEFEDAVGETNAAITLDHASHSPCCSVQKVKDLLGVKIKYSIMDIFYEYLEDKI